MAELMKTGEGRICGVVTLNDSSVVIPNVVVRLSSLNTASGERRSTVSDSEGRFEFIYRSGSYKLHAELPPFTTRVTDLVVMVTADEKTDATVSLDIPSIHLSLRNREREDKGGGLHHAIVGERVVAHVEKESSQNVIWTAPADSRLNHGDETLCHATSEPHFCDDDLEMEFRRAGHFFVRARIVGTAIPTALQATPRRSGATGTPQLTLAIAVRVTEAPAHITGDLQVHLQR